MLDSDANTDDAVLQMPYSMAKNATKNVTITLRLEEEEHAAWQAAAKADDRSLSSWIRRTCGAAAPGVQEAPKPKRKGR